MPQSKPDARSVYLALRHELLSGNGNMKIKNLRPRIQKLSNSPEVSALIREHSIDSICQVAKTLLGEGIYQSTLKAKLRFPDIFEVSPAQSAERELSELEAARCESDAWRNVMQSKENLARHDETEETVQQQEAPAETSQTPKRKFAEHRQTTRSLYPAYLPLKTQHRLLVEVQRVLETTCFNFGCKEFPKLLELKGWDCSESVELNVWASMLRNHTEVLDTEILNQIGRSLDEVLNSMTHLRHTAVHRERVTVRRLEQFLVDAEALSRLLSDDASSLILANLRSNTQATVDELKRSKDLLESRISMTQKEFQRRKADLDVEEEFAIAEILAEDRMCAQVVGEMLNKEIQSVLAAGAGASASQLPGDTGDNDVDEPVPAASVTDMEHSGKETQEVETEEVETDFA